MGNCATVGVTSSTERLNHQLDMARSEANRKLEDMGVPSGASRYKKIELPEYNNAASRLYYKLTGQAERGETLDVGRATQKTLDSVLELVKYNQIMTAKRMIGANSAGYNEKIDAIARKQLSDYKTYMAVYEKVERAIKQKKKR